jgi:hypothetical protein
MVTSNDQILLILSISPQLDYLATLYENPLISLFLDFGKEYYVNLTCTSPDHRAGRGDVHKVSLFIL